MTEQGNPSDERPRVPEIPEGIITLAMAAEKFGLSRRQLNRLVSDGRIDSRNIGSTVITTEEAVRHYMENDPGRKHDPLKKYRQQP